MDIRSFSRVYDQDLFSLIEKKHLSDLEKSQEELLKLGQLLVARFFNETLDELMEHVFLWGDLIFEWMAFAKIPSG